MLRCSTYVSSCFGLLLIAFGPAASAECSDSRIKRLADQGRTVASIARTCEMSRSEVQSILDEQSDDDEDEYGEDDSDESGLPSGTPVGQCGCWGYVDARAVQPHPQCRSGKAKPEMCNAMCPAGGYAWRGVCT
jgi:hypothetical protein